MKAVSIADRDFSKVMCGTNPFYGHSHFSGARDAEYLSRFDDQAIERTIRRCLALGMNAVESTANERIVSILERLRGQNPAPIRFLGSTRVDETSEMRSHQRKLDFLIEKRADVCIIHAQHIDRSESPEGIAGLERMLEQIHGAGLLAGISTHRVRTVELCERKHYAIDAYVFPLNLSGFAYPGYRGTESVKDRIDLVRGVSKPFILMKILGAGRIPPEEGIRFVAEHSKPDDLFLLGFGTEDEISESVALVEKYCPAAPR
jgi:hypothetical protein